MEDFLENNLRKMEAGFCFIRIFAIRIKETISMNQQYPSVLLEKAVGEFAKLPGIGRKTAMRLVLHLLRQDTATVEAFSSAISTLKKEVKYCKVCHNISDTDVCRICSNPSRDVTTVCVVENIRDVMAVENTQQYRGLYHVLGGVISPMDGIGPSDLEIESLVNRVMAGVALDFKRWTVGLDGEFGCCKLASNSKTRNLAFFFTAGYKF